ncbi:MAG: hybrid sensor histidine kinase/response regulator [Proteobacteria bacterium]|nr:hybrid sensor histidine kinase/response regulator [Pseudomonadota bacterium]
MESSVKCLLVDDLEENLLALAALLRRPDLEILSARSGREALELLLVHDVALALVDVQMPEMDGFELAELMRGSERTRQVPIIFVTAGARDQHRLFKGYESGAVDFLFKPIEAHILQNKADVFFQLHRHKQQLARELREKTETLRLNEMLTAVLSHDLRSPLNAVLTSAVLIQRRSTEQPVLDTAARILSSGKRMSRMIEDMLDMARARLAGGIPIKREAADLGALLDRVVGEVQAAWPERRIEVHKSGNLNGNWDGERLAQVTANLLGNALQHGDEADRVQVDVDAGRADAVIIAVTNSGTIPADLLPQLFDPFRGTQRQAGRAEGLGLGLYIVQQIILAHGGSVDVQSGENNRTTFTVSIPR